MIDLDIIDREFKKYVEQFDMSVEKISLKYEHTFEVVRVTDMICKLMNLNDEDTALAKTIVYFHDIGRFIQAEKIDSYDDSILDHAILGVELLFDNNYIKNFNIDEKYYNIIKKAIINHNRVKIEEGLTEREEFFSKLIRDADKIDILRVNNKYRPPKFLEEPSPRVLEEFNNKNVIKRSDCKYKPDDVFLILAFVYDINFKESFKVLDKLNYLKEFLDIMKTNNKTEKLYKEIKETVLKDFNNKLED